MSTFFRKLRWLTQRDRMEAELREELQFHLREEAEERQALGLAEDQARWAARRDLGNFVLVQEDTRATWGWPMLEDAWRDFRYGARLLVRNPGFTMVVVCSLALGIGANTALFSVMDAMMLRMLPVPRADEIVRLRTPLSYPAFRTIRDRAQTLAGMSAFSIVPASVRVDQDAEQAVAQMVSGNFYTMLGVNAAAGRLLSSDDDRIPGVGGGDGPVAVISYQRRHRQRQGSLSREPL